MSKVEEGLVISAALLGSVGWLVASAYASTLPPPATYDKNGVRMIYPTKNGREAFMEKVEDIHDIYVPITDNNDGTYTIDADSNYPIKFNGVRMGLYAPDNGKWHNQEITGFFKTKSWKYPDAGITLYGRSFGRHSATTPCTGTGYKGTIVFDGSRTFIKKEVWHNGGYTGQLSTNAVFLGDIKDRWIGLKTVIYDVPPNKVRTELYLDVSGTGDSWTKVSAITDGGGLRGNNPPPECTNPFTGQPRKIDEILTGAYDGKDAVFRIDNAVVQFKWLSAREIIPPV